MIFSGFSSRGLGLQKSPVLRMGSARREPHLSAAFRLNVAQGDARTQISETTTMPKQAWNRTRSYNVVEALLNFHRVPGGNP